MAGMIRLILCFIIGFLAYAIFRPGDLPRLTQGQALLVSAGVTLVALFALVMIERTDRHL